MSNTAKKTIYSAMLFSTLAAGCGDRTKAPEATGEAKITQIANTKFAHEALEKFRTSDAFTKDSGQFTDSHGTPISLNTVKTFVDGNYSTLSFMFYGCGTTCPRVTTELDKISDSNPEIKHVVISVTRPSASGNDDLKNFLHAQGLNDQNTLVLYPATRGKSGADFSETSKIAASLQSSLDLVTRGNDPTFHNPRVLLYKPSGKLVTDVNIDVDENVASIISDNINKDRQQGQQR